TAAEAPDVVAVQKVGVLAELNLQPALLEQQVGAEVGQQGAAGVVGLRQMLAFANRVAEQAVAQLRAQLRLKDRAAAADRHRADVRPERAVDEPVAAAHRLEV